MVPQICNCGIIAIYGIAEHCGFLNLKSADPQIRNCPQSRKYSANPQISKVPQFNCGIFAGLRNICGFEECPQKKHFFFNEI
jgi:hypothetical protein